jgi:uncharacterized damage-inducible protein DinB
MTIAAGLLSEFDQESKSTRRLLERVPDAKLGWRPHPKSHPLAWLAGHVAQIPTWMQYSIAQDELDIDPVGGFTPPPLPESTREILQRFDAHMQQARTVLAGASDATLMQPWTLKKRGVAMLTLPRAAVVRGFVMNHGYHHRGQLTVYLRLLDVPLPSIYGPTADEAF